MRVLKILGLVILILLATLGGAALRLKEVIFPKVMPELIKNEGAASSDISADVSGIKDDELALPVLRFDPSLGTVNVLVVGLDEVDKVRRSDTIALAIFDEANRAVRIASIPRDSRVQIPRKGWDKINHAYAYGGLELLRETVVNLTGMSINYFVVINYQSFPRIIDIMGGIDIDVEKKLVYSDYSGKLFINIPKGPQHMDGKTALEYVRFRHDPLGDIGRIQRQQKFMDIVLAKLKSFAILPRIPALVEEAVNSVNTDLTPLEALRLLQFANSLPSDRIRIFMAPGKAGYANNLSYWILDTSKLSMELSAKLPPESEDVEQLSSDSEKEAPSAASELSAEEFADLRGQIGRIGILNGNGEDAIGKKASLIFQRAGVDVGYTGNAKHFDYHTSNVVYPPGASENDRKAAKALARICGIYNPALVREDKKVSMVCIILGHDKDSVFKRIESYKAMDSSE